jgi:hypothetical protein
MKRTAYMNRSSERGIFLSSIVVFVILLSVIPITSYAAEAINVKSSSLEETTIIEFTNNGKEDVDSVRIWLDKDFNFKSFKTEKGWSGETTSQGVIIFTSQESVGSGESIKIGVKTDKPSPQISWKALDKNQDQLGIGKTIPGKLSQSSSNQTSNDSGSGVLPDSTFRIIPEKPSAGSTIRVTGDNFGPSQQFDFYIDTKKIGTFETNEEGYFMTTMQIPEEQSSSRVDLSVRDKTGVEKKISLRIGETENKIPQENVKLTIKGIPDTVHRGDTLKVSGTAQPNSVITGSVKDSDGKVINTRTASVNSKGDWEIGESIIIPTDAIFGKYTIEISDGTEDQIKHLTIESSKVITLAPITLRFDPGDIIKFNGTALPDKPVEIVLKDPIGDEKFTGIIEPTKSGLIEIEYKTIANVDKEGTWTIIATQEKNTEFSYAGLGETPSIPINFKFDKQNYKSTETAIIILAGKESEKISMLIIDPSDKPKGEPISITLEPDGRQTYSLDLKGYTTGIYSAVVSKGSSKSTGIFTVGLQTGSSEININSTKLEYRPGESILLLGNADPNVLLTITLSDPDGKVITSEESFSDKNGNISDSKFKVPLEAKLGKWKINAKSGSNFNAIEIEVVISKEVGMSVTVSDGIEIPGFGKSIDIKVANAVQTVKIEIISSQGEIIETLSFPASGNGEVKLPWFIPVGTPPGTYTIKAKDSYNTAETTFQIK